MKKFNPSKKLIISLVVLIIVIASVSVTSLSRGKKDRNNFIQSVTNDTLGFVDRGLTAPVRWIGKGVDTLQDLIATYQENQDLKKKIDGYELLAVEVENQKKEIAELQEQLKLNETLTSFDTVTGSVISRSPNTWQDILIVNKGSKDGIEVNMPVMSQKGLVGRVIEVNAASSKVELLSSQNKNANHFPVKISSKDGESFGLLTGYDDEKGSLAITQLTGNYAMQPGDVVQTSGLGGNSPANLVIGTVSKVENSGFGLDRTVLVTPYAELYNINTVTIVKRLVGEK